MDLCDVGRIWLRKLNEMSSQFKESKSDKEYKSSLRIEIY